MKLQNAVEYLTAYGWAILILAVLIGAFYELGVFNPQGAAGSQCVLQSEFSCTSYLMNTSGYLQVKITWTGTSPIYVTGIGCSQNVSNMIFQAPSQGYIPDGSSFSATIQCYTSSGSAFSDYSESPFEGNLAIKYTNAISGAQEYAQGSVIVKPVTDTPIPSTLIVAQFNGVSSYVTLPYSSVLNPTSNIAISVWVFPASSGSIYATIVKKVASVDNSYKIDESPSGNKFRGYITDSASGSCIVTASSPFSANTWYMLTYTYNTLSGGVFYVNGALQGTCSDSNPIETSSNTEFIGGNGYYFQGSISNVQIYNTALSTNSVQNLYQEGIGGVPISSQNLVGWWPLNGNTRDNSGNGNSGVPTNVIYTQVSAI